MTGHNTITKEQIDTFVAAWYLALDQHVSADQCGRLVSEDVEMILPEKTLHGKGDFLAWYAGGTYSDGTKAIGVINYFFDENHTVLSIEPKISGDLAELDVIVAWQARCFDPPAAKSKLVSLDANQKWTVKKSGENPYGLVVTNYNAIAKPLQYAPGFARL